MIAVRLPDIDPIITGRLQVEHGGIDAPDLEGGAGGVEDGVAGGGDAIPPVADGSDANDVAVRGIDGDRGGVLEGNDGRGSGAVRFVAIDRGNVGVADERE